ncbi:hypothetical protein [Thermus islandicus]|uniref:hypothetical protein n=1 Tax=Thermus islandicus TaxID=540988 RepID=UPI0003B7AEDA|nr:hypothetical protein [Thermus islandicus]
MGRYPPGDKNRFRYEGLPQGVSFAGPPPTDTELLPGYAFELHFQAEPGAPLGVYGVTFYADPLSSLPTAQFPFRMPIEPSPTSPPRLFMANAFGANPCSASPLKVRAEGPVTEVRLRFNWADRGQSLLQGDTFALGSATTVEPGSPTLNLNPEVGVVAKPKFWQGFYEIRFSGTPGRLHLFCEGGGQEAVYLPSPGEFLVAYPSPSQGGALALARIGP